MSIPDAIDVLLVGGPAHGQRFYATPSLDPIAVQIGTAWREHYTRCEPLDLLYAPDGQPAVYIAKTVQQCGLTRHITAREIETFRLGVDELIKMNKDRMKRDAVEFVLKEGTTPISRGMWIDRKRASGERVLELRWVADSTVTGTPHTDWPEIEQRAAELAQYAEFRQRRALPR